jgi:hypothetical protein
LDLKKEVEMEMEKEQEAAKEISAWAAQEEKGEEKEKEVKAPVTKVLAATSKAPPPVPQSWEDKLGDNRSFSIWDGKPIPVAAPQPAAPQPAAPLQEAEIGGEVHRWLDVLEKERGESLMNECREKLEMVFGGPLPAQTPFFFLLQPDNLAFVKFDLLYPAEEKVKVDWPYEYEGFHGTDCVGAKGILSDKRVKVFPNRSGGIFLFAGQSPSHSERVQMLAKATRHKTKGAHGLIFCLTHSGHEHKPLKGGEDGVAGQVKASNEGFVSSYMVAGEGRRWTFPPKHTGISSLWVNLSRFGSIDVAAELRAASAF